MGNSPPVTEKTLKRLVERFRANYLSTLHVHAGDGGPFRLDDHYQLWRGETHLGQLKLKGGRITYDPPVEQASGAGHDATEFDIRNWALAAWTRAPKPN